MKDYYLVIDELDLKILRVLQEDSSLTVTEIAKRVGLSASPCWKRINRLESDGVIKYQAAVLDGRKLGVNLTVFMSIRTGEHSGAWLENFAKIVKKMPEVQEFHRMAGEIDYLLKIVAPSIEDYDFFQQKLIGELEFTKMSSSISLQEMKHSHILPLKQCSKA